MTEPHPDQGAKISCALTARELATVLAALRYWQEEMTPHQHAGCNLDHLADLVPLDADEIDALCERLNTQAAAHGS